MFWWRVAIIACLAVVGVGAAGFYEWKHPAPCEDAFTAIEPGSPARPLSAFCNSREKAVLEGTVVHCVCTTGDAQ